MTFISVQELMGRLARLNLWRRSAHYDINVVRDSIIQILDGPGCVGGYRTVLHSLQLRGIRVPRSVVLEMLRALDPEDIHKSCTKQKQNKKKTRKFNTHQKRKKNKQTKKTATKNQT